MDQVQREVRNKWRHKRMATMAVVDRIQKGEIHLTCLKGQSVGAGYTNTASAIAWNPAAVKCFDRFYR